MPQGITATPAMESLDPMDTDSDPDLLDVTIRFSAPLPDLLLTIPDPSVATTSTLKQRIRSHLPDEYSNRRIRLIYSGRALTDTATLLRALRLNHLASRTPSRTPTPTPWESGNASSSHRKGKAAVRDPPAASRHYVHCSIGDVVLSPTELAEEALLANPPPPSVAHPASRINGEGANVNLATTTPAPRGFDRLLTAGFSPAEVLTLRSQFLAIQAYTHTPDDMPSLNTLRDLEDEWLDNSNAADGSVGSAGTVDEENAAGALDDMLWGAVAGFFWPIGCLWWACREEGIWTRRRKMAVVVGVVVNAGLGGLRWVR